MTRDRYAVIWTRTDSGPVKVGSLVATPTELRFSYTNEYANRPELPALTLLLPQSLLGEQAFVWPVSEAMPLPPRLMALLPGHNPRNIQRRFYLDMLARRAQPPAPGFDTDWNLLMIAGHGGIGHIDVFEDDRAAIATYAKPVQDRVVIGTRSGFWKHVRSDARGELPDPDGLQMLELLGPTPSVGGMIPKLLASIPDRKKWRGEIAAPGLRAIEGEPFTDVIVKIEYPEYQGLAELEGLCLEVHRELGFDVPRHWLATVDDQQLIAIERFDRTADGLPIPMESFFSVYALGKRAVRASTDAEMEDIEPMLRRVAQVAPIDSLTIAREVYRRFLAALVTGNGDIHLENLAFLGGPGSVRLSPVYDPSPMRAWNRHNLLSALPFEIDDTIGVGGSVVRLGKAFGFHPDEAQQLVRETLRKTRDYPERVRALNNVPESTRKNLITRVKETRLRLEKPGR